MLQQITIQCDRCKEFVDGIVGDIDDRWSYTGGFYDVSQGSWAEFSRNEEKVVCDTCMHLDPKYRALYDLP